MEPMERSVIEHEARPQNITHNGKPSLEEWSMILNCEKDDLLKAMSIMGSSVRAVDDYLVLNRRKKS